MRFDLSRSARLRRRARTLAPLLVSAACLTSALAQDPVEIESETQNDGDIAPIELDAPIPDPSADEKDRKAEGGDKEAEKRPQPRIAAGGRVLTEARAKLKKRGCAAAAPAYRVAAAMGEGFEAAQHELGDCLMEMQGATETETALFRQEGLFWLTRAAHAGNARAQRRLAILHASPVAGAHDPAAALKWSLAYGKNPEADLFGRGPLPSTMVEGLIRDLPEDVVADARAFAAEFAPTPLDGYEPPKPPKGAENSRRGNARSIEARRRGGGRRGPGAQPVSE